MLNLQNKYTDKYMPSQAGTKERQSPRLWGVDYGFGGFCKGSWEEDRSSFWVS
jgi:hypothetical protein